MSLKSLVQSLQKNSDQLKSLQNIEYSQISNFYWVNLVQTTEDRLISDRTYTGFDANPEVALAKAISECVERNAFIAGDKLGLESCNTERSDGFAAYPKLGITDELAQEKARENALSEAIERFAWATWWDDIHVSFKYADFSLKTFEIEYADHARIISEINNQKEIIKIHVIRPEFQSYGQYSLNIVVVEFSDGIVTGGACGKLEDELNVMTRATSEMLRHALVLIQNKPKPIQLSLYEERLLYYGSPQGKQSFYNRISQIGKKKITFPALYIDEKIPSVDTHSVYRCLFEDQPPFIGGAVERMCL